jgi:hypothetical protein
MKAFRGSITSKCRTERVAAAALAKQPRAVKLMEKLCAADVMRRFDRFTDQQQLDHFFQNGLCNEWASMLLGKSYGTGNYSMYGAFTVDLETCMITDDPNAVPVVRDIEIAK